MTTSMTANAKSPNGALPPGWRMVRFGDVVRNINVTVDPEESGLERYVAGEHMTTDDLHIRRWGTIGDGYLGPAFHRKFVAGQVLYGSRRTYLRKVAVADFDGICANTTFVLEPLGDELIPELLPFIMQTESFVKHSMQQSRGSTNPYVTFKDLAWYEFALPPRDEQRRIAEILWAADEAVETISIVQQEISRTTEAILSDQFGLNAEHEGKLIEFCCSDGIQIGPFGSQLHASDYQNEGIPVVMPSNMDFDKIITNGISRISPLVAQKLSMHKVSPGDILLPRRGDLSKRAYISPGQEGWICGTGSIRIRPGEGVSNRGLFYALSTRQVNTWIVENSVGTTMANLNTKIVSNIPIKMPNKQRIDTIVSMIEKSRSVKEANNIQIGVIKQLKTRLLEHLLLAKDLTGLQDL